MPNSRSCQHFCPRSGRFWLFELRVSQHFSTFYGPSVQAMDTQLEDNIDGEPRRSTEVVLNEPRLSAGSWFGQGWETTPEPRNKSNRKENTRQP